MRAMRNRLVHAYFSVDPQIIWDTIYHDLLPLVPLLETSYAPNGARRRRGTGALCPAYVFATP